MWEKHTSALPQAIQIGADNHLKTQATVRHGEMRALGVPELVIVAGSQDGSCLSEKRAWSSAFQLAPSLGEWDSATVNFMAHSFLIISAETAKSNKIRSVKGS